jgi:carbonic anhydrase
MRLFEAIVDANHRALAGDQHAGLHPAEFESELPVVALTCIDVRLNPLLPEVLGIPKDQFIWLRNAGNIITGPMSSTMRSLSLACALKGGKEIAIIGHTDCQVGRTTTMEMIQRLQAVGVDRNALPPNVNEFFGTFSSERANVIKAADIVRHSPLIGPRTPVHGLLVDTETGRVEWLVNGYQTLDLMAAAWNEIAKSTGPAGDALKSLPDFQIGEIKFPTTKIGETGVKIGETVVKIGEPAAKIGETAATAAGWPSVKTQPGEAKPPPPVPPPAKPPVPPPIPLPPRIGPVLRFQKKPK